MVEYLKKFGYKYFIREKENDEIWATKSNKHKDTFRSSAKFDCFRTTTIEELAELSTYRLRVFYKV